MNGVENLIAWYNLASPEEIAAGSTWYADAKLFAGRIATKYGLSVEQVVACLAVNSSLQSWISQEQWSEQQIAHILAGRPIRCCDKTKCCGKCGNDWCAGPGLGKAKMARILAGEPIWDVINVKTAPKHRDFYNDIMGASNGVADTWMYRAWIGNKTAYGAVSVSPATYAKINADIRTGAELVGVSAQAFQAIVWCVVRRIMSGRTDSAVTVQVRKVRVYDAV